MNHISDSQLNEYLDQIIDEEMRRQCELHLSRCADCRTRLEELLKLNSTLASFTDIEIPRDLTSSIMARLPQPSASLWTRAFAVQLGTAFGMVLFILVEVSKYIRVPEISSFQTPSFDFHSMLANLPYPVIGQPVLSLPQLPTFQIPLTSLQVSVIVAFAFLLGLVGNGILLCERPGGRK